jgi:hypothetical protein
MGGQDAHLLAETCLRDQRRPAYYIGRTLRHPDDGRKFTPCVEMAAAVNVYFDHVHSVIDAWESEGLKVELHIEAQVVPFAQFQKDLWGTSDCIIIGRREGLVRIVVIDYKHGQGKAVVLAEDEGCCQLVVYLLGAIAKFVDPVGKQGDLLDASVCVVQPRCHSVDPIQTRRLTVREIETWSDRISDAAESIMISCIRRASGGLAEAGPVGPWCDWCGAKGRNCHAWKEAGVKTLDADFSVVASTEEKPIAKPLPKAADVAVDPARLGAVLAMASSVRAFLADCEDVALAMLADGKEVPGFKRVLGRAGSRAWVPGHDPDLVAAAIDEVAPGSDPWAPKQLLSPAQLEKALGKKVYKAVEEVKIVKDAIMRADAQPTLARADDKRPALEPDNKAATMSADFGTGTSEQAPAASDW